VQLDVPFVQAALSQWSELPMRRLARRYGAPYALSGVMLDRLVSQPGKRRRWALNVADDDHPIGGQLIGADPDGFARAAATMAEAGYDVIDINLGCPVKKVLGRRRGGFLLSRPEIALEIIRRVQAEVGPALPVTVKMRRGMDDSAQAEQDFFKILDGAFEIGASAVTVHARTVAQRYAGPSRWPFLSRVKRRVGDCLILGSGDLFDAEACVRMIRQTGVDGVTIARGCIGNPWIFEECRALWHGDELPPPPSVERQREAITGLWADMLSVYGEALAPRIMRKFGAKYSEHHPFAGQVRRAFIALEAPEDLSRLLDTWYDPTSDFPPMVRRRGPGDLVAAGATL
jgi:nifR3 family TIM-barrel protein